MLVHHIALRSARPELLQHFYQNVLGLRLVHQDSQRAWWFSLGEDKSGAGDAGDDVKIKKSLSAVLMIERAKAGEVCPDPRSMELLAFAVSHKKRTSLRRQLRRHGVPIEEDGDNTTYFRDPEGRRLGISQFDFAKFLG